MPEVQEWLTIRTDLDEQVGKVRLSDFNLSLPAENIFDEPTRCYKVNIKWAKIITGALDLLTEIGVWKDAQNEGYSGIQQILQMLEGGDCMDCDGVEACLATSDIIANLQSQITANLNAIQSNDTDIANNLDAIQGNATNIANLTNRMDTAETDILALDTRVTDSEAAIQQNAQAIANNLLSIIQNDLDIADHENRITALEAGGGGGAGGSMKTTVYEIDFVANESTNSQIWFPLAGSLTNHVFSMPNALIYSRLTVFGSSSPTDAWYTIAIDGLVGANEVRHENAPWQGVLISDTFNGIAAGSRTVQLYHRTNAAGQFTTVFRGQYQIVIVEYGDIETTQALVTFDAGGHAYTIDDSGIVSNVGAGGNPDDCLRGYNLGIGDWFEVIIDLGQVRNITGIQWDAFSTHADDTGFAVAVDGVWIYGSQLWLGASQAWATLDESFFTSGIGLPYSGQIVKLRFNAPQNTIGEARMDNILVEWS